MAGTRLAPSMDGLPLVLACSAGVRPEPAKSVRQTKDLACELREYAVYGGRLYRPGRHRASSSQLDAEGRLMVTETRLAEPAALSIVAEALRREGLEVLRDDEHLARLHFQRMRQDAADDA
jgi:hypothetical protein